jgi:iron complex outermembrane receptor protein
MAKKNDRPTGKSFFSVLVLVLVFSIGLIASDHGLAQQEPSILSTVHVTADRPDGASEQGYLVNDTRYLGPWGERKLIDTPYTVNIVTEDYIENIQARSPGDLFNRIPGVNFNGGGSEHNIQHTVNVRGFPTAGSSSVRFNGVPTGNNSVATFLEEMGSIEIISGLSGFLYGSGNVGGSINYNVKRPLYQRRNKFRFGTYGRGLFYGHADLGGPVLDGKLAYRVNILAQDGDSPIHDQKLKRQLFSIALDYNLVKDLLIQMNASFGKIEVDGRQGGFWAEDDALHAFRDTNVYPNPVLSSENATYMTSLSSFRSPPDPSNLLVSKDTFNHYKTKNLGIGLQYKINEWLNFRTAGHYNEFERDMVWGNNFFTLDPDVYRADIRANRMLYKSKGSYGYLDVNFDTGPVKHKATLGASGYYLEVFNSAYTYGTSNQVLYYYTGRFSNPSIANDTNLDQYNLISRVAPFRHRNSDNFNYNILIGDDIKIGDKWEILLGVNHSTFRSRSYNANTGVRTSQYEKSANTPTFALMFKPITEITFYGSYIESLESGTIVPDNAANWINKNEALPPMKSKQYEFGAKAIAGQMLITAAFFEIQKSLQYGDPVSRYYIQDGLQKHRGLELTARGKVIKDLTVMAGMNFLDAKIIKTAQVAHIGKSPSYVPKFAGKVYAEYDLPFVEGLTLTGGLIYFGKVYTNSANITEVPAFTIGDLGARFSHFLFDQKVTYRFNVTNVTDKRYWYGGGNSHLQVGLPRTFALSAEIVF